MKLFYSLLMLIASMASLQGQICFQFDTTFGIKGRAVDLNKDFPFDSKKILIQSDQKIILLGAIHNGANNGIGVKRYTANGQPDPTFGTEGRVYSLLGNDFYPNSGAIQKDQKIIVAGRISSSGSNQLGIVRYNNNGQLDFGFGIGGLVKPTLNITDEATAITIQPDGKIVVAGNSLDEKNASRFLVVRYLSNGTIDSTFGTNGKIITHLGPFINFIGNQFYGQYWHDNVRELFLQPDGKIVVLGHSYVSCDYDYYGGVYCRTVLGMLRYHPNGSLDSSFGNDGKVLDDVFNYINSAELQEDGKILVTGNGDKGYFMTARFNQDGKLDMNFGTDGIAAYINSPIFVNAVSSDILISKGGKIMVLGNTGGQDNKVVVVQYNNDGSPMDVFAAKNSIRLHFGVSSYATAAAMQENNILIAGLVFVENTSELLFFRLSPKLAKPKLNYNGSQLTTQSGFVHYQWFFNGIPLPGNDTSSHKPTQNGVYQVVVTNAEGCSNTSDDFTHLILDSKDISIGQLKLRYYPNPVSEQAEP